MRKLGLIIMGLLASAPVAAGAQTAADDARCLLVSSAFARTAKDPKARQVAQAASAFYLGRIDGRYHAAALKAAFTAQLKLLTPTNAAENMNACAARVSAAQTRIQVMAPAQRQAQPNVSPGR